MVAWVTGAPVLLWWQRFVVGDGVRVVVVPYLLLGRNRWRVDCSRYGDGDDMGLVLRRASFGLEMGRRFCSE